MPSLPARRGDVRQLIGRAGQTGRRGGALLAHDDAHPRRPAAQIQQVGELGDPDTVADLVVGVVGRGPDLPGGTVRGVRREWPAG